MVQGKRLERNRRTAPPPPGYDYGDFCIVVVVLFHAAVVVRVSEASLCQEIKHRADCWYEFGLSTAAPHEKWDWWFFFFPDPTLVWAVSRMTDGPIDKKIIIMETKRPCKTRSRVGTQLSHFGWARVLEDVCGVSLVEGIMACGCPTS